MLTFERENKIDKSSNEGNQKRTSFILSNDRPEPFDNFGVVHNFFHNIISLPLFFLIN